MTEWIPTTAARPPREGQYIITLCQITYSNIKTYETRVAQYYKDPRGVYRWKNTPGHVTAWAYMPEPYNENR